MPEITMEEMEAQVAENTPAPRAADIKLEAADLPDFAKGSTAAQLAEEVTRARAALKISEDARLALAAAVKQNNESAPPPPPPVHTGPATMTREQLQELAREDPMAVMDYMAQHLTHNLDNHLNTRFRPILEGNANSIESQLKAKYADEFELFGDQIEALKKKVAPNVLNTQAGWDDMLAYVRGQPGNFDKLVEKRTKTRKTPTEARETQITDSGFTVTTTPRTPLIADSGETYGLDATQLEICRVMNIDPKDYKKYS